MADWSIWLSPWEELARSQRSEYFDPPEPLKTMGSLKDLIKEHVDALMAIGAKAHGDAPQSVGKMPRGATQPTDDESAGSAENKFVRASEMRDTLETKMTLKQFNAFLNRHPEIENEHRGQWLYVNAAQCIRAVRSEDRDRAAALDASAQAIGESLQGIAKRQAEIREQKSRQLGPGQ